MEDFLFLRIVSRLVINQMNKKKLSVTITFEILRCRNDVSFAGKQLLAINVSFRINKPGFRGLMSELATRSVLRRLTFMTSYI